MEFIANVEKVALERMHVTSFTKIGIREAKRTVYINMVMMSSCSNALSPGNQINSKTHNKYSDMNLEEATSHVCWHLCALK